MSTGFHGSRNDQSQVSDVRPLNGYMNAYLGQTEAFLANPNPSVYRRLFIHIEADGIFIRPGNYTELTFDSSTDVDDALDTAVVTGIEGRMTAVHGNSLVHSVDGGADPTSDTRLIYGPVQLSVAATALPTGLSADTNYWLVKALDAGVATDEVSFYASLADAKAANLVGTDSRIDITSATGTSNVGGMVNNGLSTLPHAASITDGYSSLHLDVVAGSIQVFAAPAAGLTVIGDAATADMTYWWTP